jgi:hypothetical protein
MEHQEPREFINEMIESGNEPAIPSIYTDKPTFSIGDEIQSLVASVNRTIPIRRQVPIYDALAVAGRSLARTVREFTNPSKRAFVALREVSDFVNTAVSGKPTRIGIEHYDLLPIGHPLSTKEVEISAQDRREFEADWFAADPRISEEYRPVVASAYLSAPDSVERKYALAHLEALGYEDIPMEVVVALLDDNEI